MLPLAVVSGRRVAPRRCQGGVKAGDGQGRDWATRMECTPCAVRKGCSDRSCRRSEEPRPALCPVSAGHCFTLMMIYDDLPRLLARALLGEPEGREILYLPRPAPTCPISPRHPRGGAPQLAPLPQRAKFESSRPFVLGVNSVNSTQLVPGRGRRSPSNFVSVLIFNCMMRVFVLSVFETILYNRYSCLSFLTRGFLSFPFGFFFFLLVTRIFGLGG